MSVRFTVREIARAKGFRNARHLAEVAHVSFTTMYGIWDNTKKYVSFDVLERLAKTLEVPAPMLLTDQPEAGQGETPRATARKKKLG
jgi:hypothetical protein